MSIIKGLVNLAKDVKGAGLEPCTGKTGPGIRCKKKARPGYGGCGDPKCTTTFGEAL